MEEGLGGDIRVAGTKWRSCMGGKGDEDGMVRGTCKMRCG